MIVQAIKQPYFSSSPSSFAFSSPFFSLDRKKRNHTCIPWCTTV